MVLSTTTERGKYFINTSSSQVAREWRSERDIFEAISSRFRTVLESSSRVNAIETFVIMVAFTTLNSSNADLIEVGVCWVWMDADRGLIISSYIAAQVGY